MVPVLSLSFVHFLYKNISKSNQSRLYIILIFAEGYIIKITCYIYLYNCTHLHIVLFLFILICTRPSAVQMAHLSTACSICMVQIWCTYSAPYSQGGLNKGDPLEYGGKGLGRFLVRFGSPRDWWISHAKRFSMMFSSPFSSASFKCRQKASIPEIRIHLLYLSLLAWHILPDQLNYTCIINTKRGFN